MSLTLIDNEVGDIGPTRAARPQRPVVNDIFLAQQAARLEGYDLGSYNLHPRKFARLLRENDIQGDLLEAAMRDGILVLQGVTVIRIGDAEGRTS